MPEVESELYTLIKVDGRDAVSFLQGQLTQDVERLAGSGRLLGAWCNPKGRVLVVLRLLALEDAIGLLVPASMREQVLKRLAMYRFRAKVQFNVADEELPAVITTEETDPVALIRAGIATIDDSNSELYTPHMLNLDRLDAISFSKGCYTGQEVVARTEHLGKSKRRLMRYEADRDGLRVGDRLAHAERNVGEIVNVCGRQLLAVAPVDLHGQVLQAGNVSVSPQSLPYAI